MKKCHLCNKLIDPKKNTEGHCYKEICKAKK